jgi:hypothetical protein
MRFFRLVFTVVLLAVVAISATASGKVDQAGWPHITGKNKRHFFQAKKHGANRDASFTGTATADKILGAHGSDKLLGMGGVDVIWGDEIPNNPANQTDLLDGGAGSDFIYASHGKSTIIGGDGNDKIHAHYGRGTISCGPGKDKVWQSRKRRKNWKIAKDCEKITYALDTHMNRK